MGIIRGLKKSKSDTQPLFLNPGPVYLDLTLPIFQIHAIFIDHNTPQGEVGFGANERNPSFLVRNDKRINICGKAFGVSW